ncbi:MULTISPECIES: DUF2795 domain-containing protein [unclassified Microcoleus]|uniref:DUF2795 domain-containing protein n=1 Tax=unclassified Microcoleus TaxID=2642155 RepID=UPI002FD4459F
MAVVTPVQVQKFLKAVDYPTSKQDLVEHAKQQGAIDRLQASLNERVQPVSSPSKR